MIHLPMMTFKTTPSQYKGVDARSAEESDYANDADSVEAKKEYMMKWW